jgi:hypothetical protein
MAADEDPAAAAFASSPQSLDPMDDDSGVYSGRDRHPANEWGSLRTLKGSGLAGASGTVPQALWPRPVAEPRYSDSLVLGVMNESCSSKRPTYDDRLL